VQEGDFGFSKTSATVRLVCAGWKAVHDALVRRLMLRWSITDDAVGMLVRSFPAVASPDFTWAPGEPPLTDEGLRAVSSLPALTSLNLAWCCKVTDEGLLAVIK
jgi:hypothetical protein